MSDLADSVILYERNRFEPRQRRLLEGIPADKNRLVSAVCMQKCPDLVVKRYLNLSCIGRTLDVSTYRTLTDAHAP